MNGHADVARLLLDGSADADAANAEGDTPLMRAASGGHVSAVRLLIDEGGHEAGAGEGPVHGLTALEVMESFHARFGQVADDTLAELRSILGAGLFPPPPAVKAREDGRPPFGATSSAESSSPSSVASAAGRPRGAPIPGDRTATPTRRKRGAC